ncbi:hypothetical protein PGH07_04945 [Sulfurovum sp. zt1-1]|uniref:Lipoprotein n=1 Tax=Sulfurovum zhangzhouensis TaxID=3019067 RepID=A0ABT7QXL8_9BACT|nr:hypothetical protein [Sulfurovum zhangzhouensis]MDM5271516.1 hypothetical protein [Sulfurovum zhangzhouensis]
MKKIGFFGIILLMVSISGCARHSYVKQDSALIVFKTPTFKYADMGFIYEGKEELKVEIYSSGQVLTSLNLFHGQVCMSTLQCMSEAKFNAEVLSRHYPDSLLRNVFGGKAIFDKQGYTLSRNGFTQKLFKSGKYDIEYTVLNRQIVFRDTINEILIKVKQQG